MQPQTTSTHGILGQAGGRARFALTRRPPASDVASYIERHWIVRWDLEPDAGFTQEVLPHPCANLVTEPGLVAVHGIPLSRGRRRLDGAGVAIGTKFRPGALAALTSQPGRALLDRSLPLPAVFGRRGIALERHLAAAAGSVDAHIAAVEQLIRDVRPADAARYELLRTIVADMLVADRSLGVAEFARRHAISLSTLQRLFRDYIGVTPKWLLKRYRVHEAAEQLATGEAADLARLAADLGYFDQSHFIRDFRAQVGCSPGAYARACAAASGTEAAEGTATRAA